MTDEEDREYFKHSPYFDDSVFKNRKTLRNLTMKHFDNGVMSIKRTSDNEIVYAGTYARLRKRYPLLKV